MWSFQCSLWVLIWSVTHFVQLRQFDTFANIFHLVPKFKGNDLDVHDRILLIGYLHTDGRIILGHSRSWEKTKQNKERNKTKLNKYKTLQQSIRKIQNLKSEHGKISVNWKITKLKNTKLEWWNSVCTNQDEIQFVQIASKVVKFGNLHQATEVALN